MLIPLKKINRDIEDAQVLAPFTHIQKAPSKYHLKLYRALNYWLKVPDDKVNAIEEFMQIIHSASLMIDDIQDESTFRYGVPVAHSLYSVALTVNAASHALTIALKKIFTLGTKCCEIYLEAVLEGHRGQGIDIYWRDNLECPSEDEYMDMIKQKTSFMFVMAYRLMQVFSKSDADCAKLTHLIGIYYQIRDDYCNLLAQKHSDNKTYCSDITEGKFSLPIIHAMQKSDAAKQILNILKQRTQDAHLKNYCVSILEQTGSFEYTRNMLVDLEKQIYDEINRLGGNPALSKIVDKLGDWRDIKSDDFKF